MNISDNLVAPCGMNCGICYAHLREKNRCPGCRNLTEKIPVSIARCKMRNCPKNKGEYCFNCDEFPCENLVKLDKRYKAKYGMSEIENLRFIKDFEIEKFLEKETIKWGCKKCGGVICIHKNECLECNKKQRS